MKKSNGQISLDDVKHLFYDYGHMLFVDEATNGEGHKARKGKISVRKRCKNCKCKGQFILWFVVKTNFLSKKSRSHQGILSRSVPVMPEFLGFFQVRWVQDIDQTKTESKNNNDIDFQYQ